MAPLDQTLVDWHLITATVRKASIAVHKQTGYDLSDLQFSGWFAVAKAFRLYDKDNSEGATFNTYLTPGLYRQMLADARRFSVAVTRPRDKRADELDNVACVDIAEAFDIPDNGDNADNGFNADEYPALALLLASLDDKDRDLIKARFFEEKSFTAIAASLGVTKQTAINRTNKALAVMRKAGATRRF